MFRILFTQKELKGIMNLISDEIADYIKCFYEAGELLA